MSQGKIFSQTLTGTVPLCNVKLGLYKGMLNALCSPCVTDVTFPANPIMSLFPKERGRDMRAGERTGLLDLLISNSYLKALKI